MPNYKYRAISDDGVIVEGYAFAKSVTALTTDLSNRGMLVSRVRRQLLSRGPRMRSEGLVLLLNEFISLLQAGISIPEALLITADRPGQSALAQTLSRIHEEVIRGHSLSAAFANQHAFDPLLITALRIGEKSGQVVPTLTHYQKLLERRQWLQRKAFQALLYPGFVLTMLVLIVGVLLGFSLPRFVGMYEDLGAELPGPTKVLVEAMHAAPSAGAILALLILLLFAASKLPRFAPKLAQMSDRVRFRLPFFGRLYNLYLTSLFSHTLSSLLGSGLPLVLALKDTASALPSAHFRLRLLKIATDLERGEPLIGAFRNSGLFSQTGLKLLEAGERSGTLERQLSEMAGHYDESLDYGLTAVMALLEPLLILITGLFVGGLVILMYLPIFGLASAVS